MIRLHSQALSTLPGVWTLLNLQLNAIRRSLSVLAPFLSLVHLGTSVKGVPGYFLHRSSASRKRWYTFSNVHMSRQCIFEACVKVKTGPASTLSNIIRCLFNAATRL